LTVKKQMIKLKYPYFIVKHNSATLTRQVDAMSAEDAAEELEEFLEGCSYPYVDVTISRRTPEEKSKGGAKGDDYTHRVSTKGAQAIAGTTTKNDIGNSMLMTLFKEIGDLKSEIVAKTWEIKLAELQQQMKELKDDKSNPMQEAAMMHLMNMFTGGTGIASPTSNIINGVTAGATQNNKERLKAVVNRLLAADKDIISTLEMIATFAETKPAQYEAFKPMLKAQI